MKKTSVRIMALLLIFSLLFCFVACGKSTEEPNETKHQTETERMVWIVTTGEKYHKRASCSNMKYPRQVTISEAERKGYEPCKKCY